MRERSTATESPVANAESRSKGDTMSSEMADPGSLPLVPTTPHVPAEFKTQALRSPPPRSEQLPSSLPQLVALVRSPNISVTSRVRLRQSPITSSVARRSAQDIRRTRLVARSYWAKISAVQVFPRVPQVRADLAAQSPHAQGLVGHSHGVAERADTRKTTCVHVQFPLPQFIMFLLQTFPQSAAFMRGFRSANPTQRQYQRAPSWTGVLHRAPRDHSRWSVLPD